MIPLLRQGIELALEHLYIAKAIALRQRVVITVAIQHHYTLSPVQLVQRSPDIGLFIISKLVLDYYFLFYFTNNSCNS